MYESLNFTIEPRINCTFQFNMMLKMNQKKKEIKAKLVIKVQFFFYYYIKIINKSVLMNK